MPPPCHPHLDSAERFSSVLYHHFHPLLSQPVRPHTVFELSACLPAILQKALDLTAIRVVNVDTDRYTDIAFQLGSQILCRPPCRLRRLCVRTHTAH